MPRVYFGYDEREPLVPGLKTMADAIHLRERMLLTFEVAERQRAEAGTHNHLTFKRGAKLPFEGTRSPKSMVEGSSQERADPGMPPM